MLHSLSAFLLSSTSFAHMGLMPVRHTCDGLDVSPPLAWTGVPNGAQSLVLIVDDPDAPDPAAPQMTWVHWLLYNLPASLHALPEGLALRDLPRTEVFGPIGVTIATRSR